MKKIILASQSPRREELLTRLGLIYSAIPANIDESFTSFESPQASVQDLALRKARYVAERLTDGIIIAADTIVVLGDMILGKPLDEKDAFEMLTNLSGQEHKVITGVCLLDAASGTFQSDAEVTKVLFRSLSEDEIKNYIQTGEPMDKAGAYGIQGLGAVLVDRIEGCYYNVVGLPLTKLYLMLERCGVRLLGGTGNAVWH